MCTISAITFTRYAQNGKIGMPNNLEVFGSKKRNWFKLERQNRQRSAMSEEKEP
jgi:hypothetical protein